MTYAPRPMRTSLGPSSVTSLTPKTVSGFNFFFLAALDLDDLLVLLLLLLVLLLGEEGGGAMLLLLLCCLRFFVVVEAE